MNKYRRFAALATVLITPMLPVVAQEIYTAPFTLEKRDAAKFVDRYGDPSLGTVIRTDERYNKPGLFPGPRGWFYWNYLQNPDPYQDPNLWPDSGRRTFSARWCCLPEVP